MLAAGDSELLIHVAEISITFAGFAGIASVLRDHADRSDIKVDAGRLTNMLVGSLSTGMLALVPFIPDAFRAPDLVAWKLSALVGLLVLVLFVPGVVMRVRRMARHEGFHKRSSVLNFALVAVAVAGFVACLCGLPAVNPGAGFITALIALLVASSTLFFRVIVSLLRPHAPD